jgi:hypothetical protein
MMNVHMLKHLMDIDEWVSKREGYCYSMSVHTWSTEFWIYNIATDKGQSVKSVSEIDEKKLSGAEGVEV